MENHLKSLEARLARREHELTRIIDESKASSHLERLRLQSIHDQVRITNYDLDISICKISLVLI